MRHEFHQRATPPGPEARAEWAPGLPHEPVPGSRLRTVRRGYTHHGIYVGDGRVVHYAGLHRGWHGGPVEEVSIEEFARGRAVQAVADAAARFADAEAVRRARSRLGERRYRLLTNNCEHFCNWCLNGEPRSEQVERAIAALARLVTRAAGLGRPGTSAAAPV
jgi:hypothetical protein